MSTWAVLNDEPEIGNRRAPIPVSASAFSSRRRGTPRIRMYTRRASLRTCTQELVRVLQRYVIYVIRRNDNGYLHGEHRERRIATVPVETQHPARGKTFREDFSGAIIIPAKKEGYLVATTSKEFGV